MRNADDTAVMVRGLRKSYNGRTVLDGIDLDVREGELVGLIGANGAGKTTTVECIQGLRAPDAGTVSVLGFDPSTQARQMRRHIGTQLQDSALPDRLRVGEALELFGGGTDADDRLLARFGLGQRRHSAFASLSGGERQRLFLVLAMIGRPRLLILDELTQGLDPAARRNVWDAVEQLRRDGTTVLLVTHELDEAEALCDRVIAMRAGAILDSGSPAELVDRHARWARIGFTVAERPRSLIGRLEHLRGVAEVRLVGSRVAIRGSRESIAHVGRVLVECGDVPADLNVSVPSLEDALLDLLDDASANGSASGGDSNGAAEAHSRANSNSKASSHPRADTHSRTRVETTPPRPIGALR